MFRTLAFLSLGILFAGCAGSRTQTVPSASSPAASNQGSGFHPMLNAEEESAEQQTCQNNGGTWDNSTGTCITPTPPPYDFGCDMVCQAWNGEPSPDDLYAYQWTNNGGGGGGYPYDVAVHPGPPRQGTGCNGSLLVGDNLGQRNGNTQSVKDLNVIAVPTSTAQGATSNGSIVINTDVVGYVYEDTNGGFWYESAVDSSFSASVSIGGIGVSLGSGHARGANYIGDSPPGISGGNFYGNAIFQRCFGSGLYLG